MSALDVVGAVVTLLGSVLWVCWLFWIASRIARLERHYGGLRVDHDALERRVDEALSPPPTVRSLHLVPPPEDHHGQP